MCKPLEEGGQRCASHTGKVLRSVEEELEASSSVSSDLFERLDSALAEHASTPTGEIELRKRLATAHADGDYDAEAQIRLALFQGAQQRQVNSTTRNQIRAVAGLRVDPGRAAPDRPAQAMWEQPMIDHREMKLDDLEDDDGWAEAEYRENGDGNHAQHPDFDQPQKCICTVLPHTCDTRWS